MHILRILMARKWIVWNNALIFLWLTFATWHVDLNRPTLPQCFYSHYYSRMWIFVIYSNTISKWLLEEYHDPYIRTWFCEKMDSIEQLLSFSVLDVIMSYNFSTSYIVIYILQSKTVGREYHVPCIRILIARNWIAWNSALVFLWLIFAMDLPSTMLLFPLYSGMWIESKRLFMFTWNHSLENKKTVRI